MGEQASGSTVTPRGRSGRGAEPSPLASLRSAVDSLRMAAWALEERHHAELELCPPEARDGVRNLLHYLALRHHDLRPLQRDLGRLGLSSLGRMEAHVMASLDAVARALAALDGEGLAAALPDPRFDLGDARLAEQARRVLGEAPPDRATRIMVTLPSTAADDHDRILEELLEAGMDLVRINSAHDDPRVWERMLARLDAARAATGRSCRVSIDLAGPKLRTGPLEPGHAVRRLQPRRDVLGQVLEPARVRLVASTPVPTGGEDVLPVDRRLLRRIRVDDVIELVDARGRRRRLVVTGRSLEGDPICSIDRTAYLVPGAVLSLRRGRRQVAEGEIGPLPARAGVISLRPGDRLDLVAGTAPGHDRQPAFGGLPERHATVSCSVTGLFAAIRPGHRVLFDDGLIGTVVRSAQADRIGLEVVHCAGGAARLRAEKGINLPDTVLEHPALGVDDREYLRFAAQRADLVSASFIQRPADVDALSEALRELECAHVPIALKIETATGFAQLPELLLAGSKHPGGIAVMVARGDLAVEVGFDRLAEVQEEILWLCEAAHVPVIWATQVLDGLARDGQPSRAEVTDAAMGGRAECVMLNKGPYIADAVRFLAHVLVRMDAHQYKKSSLLRALSVSRSTGEGGSPAPLPGV